MSRHESLYSEVKRSQFTMQLVKLVKQRPEHIATVVRWFPKVYPYVFVLVEKYEEIPEHFSEVFHAIVRKGREIDGSPYGRYALTLHGRGKKYGQTNPGLVKFLGGCVFVFNPKNRKQPLKVVKLKCRFDVFLKFLSTMNDVNAVIRGKKFD